MFSKPACFIAARALLISLVFSLLAMYKLSYAIMFHADKELNEISEILVSTDVSN